MGKRAEVVAGKRVKVRSWTTIAAALILSAGILIGLQLGGAQIGGGLAAKAGNAITVTGSAKTSAVADNAVWVLNSNESASSAAAAVAKVGSDATSLTKYLVDGGVTNDQITLGAVATFANHKYSNGNDTGQILSYAGSQSITVRSNDVNLINKLSNGIGSLLGTGVNINNNGPQYYVSTLNSLRPQLLAAAMKDAQVRANAITSAVGGKVGSVLSVSSGPVQVTTPDSTDTSSSGMYDTTTINKTVTVTVSVAFKSK